MKKLDVGTSTDEDVQEVRKELKALRLLVVRASEIPPPHWFGVDKVSYFNSFQRTEEHRNFDRVRTHLFHQTKKYKTWKSDRNKSYYDEKLKTERSSPEGRARLAAERRLSRWYKKYTETLNEVVGGLINGVSGQELDALWVRLEAEYTRIQKEGHEDFKQPFATARPFIESGIKERAEKLAAATPGVKRLKFV